VAATITSLVKELSKYDITQNSNWRWHHRRNSAGGRRGNTGSFEPTGPAADFRRTKSQKERQEKYASLTVTAMKEKRLPR